MNPNIRKPLLNRNLIWACALAVCSAGSYLVGSLMQTGVSPPVMARMDRLHTALVAQNEELEEARANAERRIAAMAARVAEMRAALVQMETWQISLEELGGEVSFKPASADITSPVLDPAAAAGGGVDLIAELNLLTARMNLRFSELEEVADAITRRGADSIFAPSGWPVETRHITSYRGFRKDPFTGKRQWHDGVDIDGALGDPIYTVASGIVTWSGRRSGYGELVEISHAGGYVTRYAHNSLNLVAVGDYVQQGQEIARVGRTGRVTGSSLHFEVLRNGVSVNPIDFLRKAP